MPPDLQTPPWHTPPAQQSESVVQVLAPIAMHEALHEKPLDEVGSGEQMREQHWSPNAHAELFARHVVTMRSSAAGVTGCSVVIAGGSTCRIAAMMLAWLFPSNAFRPVIIS